MFSEESVFYKWEEIFFMTIIPGKKEQSLHLFRVLILNLSVLYKNGDLKMKILIFHVISTIVITICMVSTFLYFIKKRKKFSKTLRNKEVFFLKIGTGILLVVIFFKMFIPAILDIPYYLKMILRLFRDTPEIMLMDQEILDMLP